MNKIYKVVWSKVKNCYVVVSEIAKNVITGSVKSAKIGSAPVVNGLALGALMAFVITGNVWAADLNGGVAKPTGTITYDAEDPNAANLNTSNNAITNNGNIKGGVIYVDANNSVTINKCTFTGNTVTATGAWASIYGGAIYTKGNLDIDETIFDRTTATSDTKGQTIGNEIYIAGGETNISDTKFINIDHSTASSGGSMGVINIVGGALNLENVEMLAADKDIDGLPKLPSVQGNLIVFGDGGDEIEITISGKNNILKLPT